MCSWIGPSAEVDRRHVAAALRRIAGRLCGLAHTHVGRERMLEAGHPAAKRGHQWRPEPSLERKRRARGGTCRWKAPWALEACRVGAWHAEGVLATESGVGSADRARRGETGRHRSDHPARRRPKKPKRVAAWRPSGDRAALRGEVTVVEAGDAAPTVSSLGVGGRQRLSGVGVDGRVPSSRRKCGRQPETASAGR